MDTIVYYGLVFLLLVGGIILFAGIAGIVAIINLWRKGQL